MTDVTGFPVGPEWYDRTLYKTSDIPDSKIKYDPARVPGSRYYVIDAPPPPGFEVAPDGVAWLVTSDSILELSDGSWVELNVADLVTLGDLGGWHEVAATMALPTPVEPVKDTMSTAGCVVISAPTGSP